MSWEKLANSRVPGEAYRLGKWKVGRWEDDTTLPRETAKRYAVHCQLPGLRELQGHCASVDEARALLERVVKHWLSGLPADAIKQPTTE